MAYLKHCYTAKCRFFRDSDRQSNIIWYWADDNAEHFRKYHQFNTGNYMDTRLQEWSPVGEVKGTKKYTNGINHQGYKGRKNCQRGTDYQFANGLSINDPINPVPDCCSPEPEVVAEQGTEFTYINTTIYHPHAPATGGVELGDYAPTQTTYVNDDQGGVELGDYAPASPTYVNDDQGGIELGDHAPAQPDYLNDNDGGIESGGTALYGSLRRLEATGGSEVGGDAPIASERRIEPLEGIEIGSSDLQNYNHVPDGGVEAGGEAESTGPTTVSTGCCAEPISMTLAVTFSTATGVFAPYLGQSYFLHYADTPDGATWTTDEYFDVGEPSTYQLRVQCHNATNTWRVGFEAWTAVPTPAVTCSPFQFTQPIFKMAGMAVLDVNEAS